MLPVIQLRGSPKEGRKHAALLFLQGVTFAFKKKIWQKQLPRNSSTGHLPCLCIFFVFFHALVGSHHGRHREPPRQPFGAFFGIFRPLVFGHLQFRPSFWGHLYTHSFGVICSLGMLYFCRNPPQNTTKTMTMNPSQPTTPRSPR